MLESGIEPRTSRFEAPSRPHRVATLYFTEDNFPEAQLDSISEAEVRLAGL